jgi:pimeloyl-ACP methyl ester carboxylesterase
VTLTGMGGHRGPARPDTDLETHIEDLVRLIDGLEAPRVVLVGHCYGIHPALGAAGRRPERIARIVHLDTGVPRDGDPALRLVPDRSVHERLSHGAGRVEGDDRLIPPPSPEGWRRWGSTAGVPGEALERLARLAAPQPPGTLTRPLRLSEAVSGLPATGVLCTANGPGIAAVEAMARLGDPRVRVLADPRVGFFELATGHWPMLSCPGELADVLLRAAAGEGYRLSVPAERPAHLRPFILDVPEAPRERTGRVDLHLPDADGPRPAVVFVHGGPVPPGTRP